MMMVMTMSSVNEPRMLLFTATVLLVLSARLDTVTSCSCMSLPSASDYFCSAPFVSVVTITGDPANCGFYAHCYPFKLVRPLKVELSRIKKGFMLNATSIRTAEDEAMCGVHFEPNEDYLVSGTINDIGDISVYLCNLVENWTRMPATQKATYIRLFEPKLFCGEREDV